MLGLLVDLSMRFMTEHFPKGQGYWQVAFSGGKDSIVLYDLVKRSGLPYKVHMVNTTIDPPEIMKFVHQQYPEVEIINAPSFFRMMKHKSYPLRFKRWCCDTQKKLPAPQKHTLCGVRAEESDRRRKRGAITLTNKASNYYPIFNWAADEIWEYIHVHKLKYPSLYDEGFKRIGCVFCPFMMHLNAKLWQHMNRWPRQWEMLRRTFFGIVDHDAWGAWYCYVTGQGIRNFEYPDQAYLLGEQAWFAGRM